MSSDHFKGKFEVELKYRLPSREAFLKQLHSMDYQTMLEDNIESDCYFDTADKQLLMENKSLCIREMEPSGIKLWIVKGPEVDRCEANNITDAKMARSMLKTMGFDCVLQMKKQRSIYFIGEFHLTLDQLPGVGDFAEFAIMTDDETRLEQYRAELIDLARRFQLESVNLEHKSYRTLFTEYAEAAKTK
ncbi:class IV adenylate cyclase [Vibrio sp. 99-8-1]|uniref:class IV adenylate cyclase n=1 Tax=Vibrio sp. 99-8-1 TaxID=2607602 RepID=UPI00149398BA|nr:class IV adenylate cyclase [Vibrio sp. 99-8-1]NOI64754.1 class IV adenylate cyclase [Vibrio sp. 99-8-1]